MDELIHGSKHLGVVSSLENMSILLVAPINIEEVPRVQLFHDRCGWTLMVSRGENGLDCTGFWQHRQLRIRNLVIEKMIGTAIFVADDHKCTGMPAWHFLVIRLSPFLVLNIHVLQIHFEKKGQTP